MSSGNSIFDSIDTFKIEYNSPVVQSNITTTYKAQGSTYSNTFVDCEDIIVCRTKASKCLLLKELYTAVSRCKDNLFLYISKERLETTDKNEKLECGLCNIEFTRNYDLKKHLKSKEHNKNRENITNLIQSDS